MAETDRLPVAPSSPCMQRSPLDQLFLPADGEFHVLFRRFCTDCDFGELRPIAFLGDPHQRAGPNLSGAEAPLDAFAIVQQLQLGLQKTTVVERAHPISLALVVVGDDPEGLESRLAISLGTPDSLD